MRVNWIRSGKAVIVWMFFLGIFMLQGCTMIRMGRLFLKGRIEQRFIQEELDFDYKGNLIVFDVKINNSERDYRFIFDTGAAFNVVSSEIAGTFQLVEKAKDSISDVNRKRGAIPFTVIDDIEVGGVHFFNTAAAVMDLDRTPELKCYNVDGVIGANLIRLVPHWKINYSTRRMIFSDRPFDRVGEQVVYTIPFKKSIQRIPEVEVVIDGREKLNFSVDLGSARAFSGSLEQLKKLRRLNGNMPLVKKLGEISQGALGVSQGVGYTGKVKNLKIGNLSLKNPTLDFYEDTHPTIGNGFFGNYIFILDWNNKEIRLIPNTQDEPVLCSDSFGFQISYDEQGRYLYVNVIYDPSPAQREGLQVRDKIVEINGRKIGSVTLSEYCRSRFDPAVFFGRSGEIELKVERNGQVLEFFLKKSPLSQFIGRFPAGWE